MDDSLVVRKNNAMLLKETPKEMNRLKSNYSARRSIYALLMTLLLLFLFAMAMFVHRIHALNPCSQSMHETTETTETNMRYPKSLTPSPTVAKISTLVIQEVVSGPMGILERGSFGRMSGILHPVGGYVGHL